MDTLKFVEDQLKGEIKLQSFKAGDTVTVYYKIKEGEKERIQQFQGVVLQRRGSGVNETFTVRKISNGIGVERIFPVFSPNIDKVVINKRGHVRRARIFYLRERTGKAARIKEKRGAIIEPVKQSKAEPTKTEEKVAEAKAKPIKPVEEIKAEVTNEANEQKTKVENSKEEAVVKNEEAK